MQVKVSVICEKTEQLSETSAMAQTTRYAKTDEKLQSVQEFKAKE
jgi:hypothetical protein